MKEDVCGCREGGVEFFIVATLKEKIFIGSIINNRANKRQSVRTINPLDAHWSPY